MGSCDTGQMETQRVLTGSSQASEPGLNPGEVKSVNPRMGEPKINNYMKDIETIRKNAIDKVDVFLELANDDNPRQQELGWGPYVYYRFLHSEEYFEEIVTFADKEEAEAYLQSELEELEADAQPDDWTWLEDDLPEGSSDMQDEDDYLKIKSWDEKIRRGTDEYSHVTIGLADAEDFVHAMPVELALDLFSNMFYYRLIPGYYEEH